MNTPTYLLPPERRPVVAAAAPVVHDEPGNHTVIASYDGLHDLPAKDWRAEALRLAGQLNDARQTEAALKSQLAEVSRLADTPIADVGDAFVLLTKISGAAR